MPIYGMAGETGKGPYRTGSSANWKAATAVAVGDAVYGDTSDLDANNIPYDKAASAFTGSVNHATTQASFKALFRGYSNVRRTTAQATAGSRALDGPIIVSGEFTKPCTALASAAIAGAYVGPAQGASTTTLSSTNVEIVASVSGAIGKLTKNAIVGDTYLTFEILPATFDGGVQAVS